MNAVKVLVLAAMVLAIPACSSVANPTPSPFVTPAALQSEAQIATTASLMVAFANMSPVQAGRVRADALAVDTSIKNDVLPLFTGAAGNTVLVSTVDDVLAKLGGLVPPPVGTTITSVIGLIGAAVPLPALSTAVVPAETQAQIAGVLQGISAGIEAALATPAPAPVPTPAPAPAPATTRKANGPVWPHAAK